LEKTACESAKLHEKIANQRKDFLHKKSHELVQQYDAIVIEDLNMKGMEQVRRTREKAYKNRSILSIF
jgi:putative transposase